MRVMVMVKATEDSEQGLKPTAETAEMFVAMGKFNEELVKAGIMLSGDGLKPSSQGKRGAFDGLHAAMMVHPAPWDVAMWPIVAAPPKPSSAE